MVRHGGVFGPQYGPVAVSALGSGRACPATVIAFCPSCQLVARPLSVRRTGVHPLPTSAGHISCPGSTGLGVHAGQGSLPVCLGGGGGANGGGGGGKAGFLCSAGVRCRKAEPCELRGTEERRDQDGTTEGARASAMTFFLGDLSLSLRPLS